MRHCLAPHGVPHLLRELVQSPHLRAHRPPESTSAETPPLDRKDPVVNAWKSAFNPKNFAIGFQIAMIGADTIHLGPLIRWRDNESLRPAVQDHFVWCSPTGRLTIHLGERPRQFLFGAQFWQNDTNAILWVFLGFLTCTVARRPEALFKPNGLLNRPLEKIRTFVQQRR